ncbi:MULTISPECIES: hypothetical protein [unclassified Arthrobacter]|uniref:hypothetical protein n=1 Tax=unclassified Arthrobacter TaxID=235627 RepID=UPI0011B05C76|nr:MULTISPECIES: hypothetical protein [unclassified Arthrobacter]
MKRLSRLTTSAAAAAGLSAGAAFALLKRLLNNKVVEQAGGLPVTPVPRDTVSATAAQDPEDPDEPASGAPGLPTRTWIVDNSADWDGSPLELVVPAGRHRKAGTPNP